MQKVITTIITLLSLIIAVPMMSQSVYVAPKVPEKSIKALQQAVIAAKAGYTEDAIKEMEDLKEKFPTWLEPRQELSRVYYLKENKNKAIQELEEALAIDTASQLIFLNTLGQLYEETGDPMRALACYKKTEIKASAQSELQTKASNNRKRIESKLELYKEKYSIALQPFDSPINTSSHESQGRWSLDGQKMVFTRYENKHEDIFIAHFDSLSNAWKTEPFAFNSSSNEGGHAISPDGNYLVFTSDDLPGGMGSSDLYLTAYKNNAWMKPINMGQAFNSSAWDGQPCFGLDGLSLYFSSSRAGGMGGRDIWYVYQISTGKWSKPINAGPAINTPANEESPFVHFDGRTLYFMRDGENGLGDYDLYISRKALDDQWQKAINMEAPINTSSKEGTLSLHPNGRDAILTRETPEQKNDLFSFILPEQFRAAPLQVLKLTIKDIETLQPVRAKIEIFEVDQFDTVRVSQGTDEKGNVSITLEQNKTYGLISTANEYFMHSSSLSADTSAARSLELHMIPIKKVSEEVIVLRNILFATGSAELLPASDPELEKVLWTLRNHPEMKIEIYGHTDNVGDEALNQALSTNRAKAVYDYLMSRGVDSSRLSYTGFGESKPIADNNTDDGRRENRRTEVKIRL